MRGKRPTCALRLLEQREGLVTSDLLLLAGSWEGSQGPAQHTYSHRVDEAVARPEWLSSGMLRALGRKLSSLPPLSEQLLSLRGSRQDTEDPEEAALVGAEGAPEGTLSS